MEHESPIMKALREFALADPEDCDREYEAYLALVNKTDTASVSSPTRTSSVSPPTNSTLPLHNHVHCPAVVSSSSTTRSAASLHDPSSAMSSTAVSKESASRWDRDDVFPPLAELRRALMTDAEWAAMSEWEKDLWEMKHLPEKERMNSIEGIVMWLPAAQQDQRRKELLEEILRFAEPSPTPDSSTSPASTSDSSIVLSVAAELDIVPLAVHKDTTDLATPTPTTCSTDCLNRAVVSPVSALISSAIPISATTNHGAMPEHCCFNLEPAADASMDVATSTTYQRAPAVLPSDAASTLSQWLRFLTPTSALDLLEGGDDFTSMSPSICSILCQGCGIGTVGSAACSIDLIFARGASTSSLTPATYLLDDVDITKRSENMFPPWPPPWFVSFQDVNMCKDMLQALLLYGLFLQSMQTSGDWHVSKTVELKVWPALLLSIFVPEVQSTLLRATMFKWSYLLCSDIHSLSSSTLDSLLARRAAHIVWKWCCLDNFHGSFGSINWALEEEKWQVLLSMPWPSFRYHRVAAYLILLWKLPTGHSHEDPNGFAGSFVLHWTSFSDENQMHLFTAAETFWCKLFSVGKTGDCLESEHQQQWRPPDQVTLLACMGALFLRFKACLSDGQWALSTGAIFEAEYLEVHNFLYRLTSNHFSTELFVIENWLIPWGPGNDSPGHNLMGHFTSLAITFELLCSISDDDNLLADCYLLWCMSCVQVDRPRNCVSYWRPNPPWSHPAPTNSTSEIVSDLRTVFESLHICDNSFKLDIIGFAAWYMFCAKNIILCTSFHQVRVHPPGMHDMFSIMLMSSASLVFVEVCPSSTEKMQHSVMLEKLKPGLSLELHLLVLVVMRKEAVPWPFFQPTSSDTILLLPWDPGALMYGMCTKYPVELEQKWMVSLVEQLAIVKFPAMPYTIHHHPPSGDLMVLIAAANSDIVTYLHSRGPPASDEPDCVASKNLVVPNASTSPGFSFTRIRVVVTFPPGHDVGQDSNMLLAVCPVHWKIVWSLVLKCSASGNKAGQPLDTTTVNSEDYFEKKSAVLPPFSPRTVQASLQASTVTFHSSAHVAVCGSCGMNLGQGQLSCDPSIRAVVVRSKHRIQAVRHGIGLGSSRNLRRGEC